MLGGVAQARTLCNYQIRVGLQGGFAEVGVPCNYTEAPVTDYESALASRSRGLLKGRSAWNDGRLTYLVDLPLVVLIVNRLRTPEARRFQMASIEQSFMLMAGREDIARRLAAYWRAERMARPDNCLLQFLGVAVDHELPASASAPSDHIPQQLHAQVTDAIARALPQLCDTLKGHIDQRFEHLASRFGAERAIVARPSSGTVGGGADSRPLPLTQYLDEREEEARVAPTAHML